MAGVAVSAGLEQALNAHDLELLAGCFDEQVVSEQPAHPSRGFRGRVQIEKNCRVRFYMQPAREDGAGVDAAVREHAGRS